MLSLLGIPGLLAVKAPQQVVATQWAGIYDRGRVLGPVTALISLAGYAYLAYDHSSRGLEWKGLVAAGALSAGIIPFTLIFMAPTNAVLLGVAGGAAEGMSDDAVRELIRKWANLNLARSIFPLAGAVVGFWNLVH
jgi:noranthrone monooxygenase